MSDRLALITGASRGFGAAVAETLAADGWHVVAVARTVGALEELDDRIKASGGSATLVPLDITDDDGIARMGAAVFERWGGADLWLHSALFAGPLAPAAHVPPGDWDKVVAVNIRATQRLIAMVEPLVRARAGTAVLPIEARAPGQKFMAAHGAAKAAQRAIWDSWARETTRAPHKVITFAPKPMPTALRARFYPGEDRAALTPPKVEAARLRAVL